MQNCRRECDDITAFMFLRNTLTARTRLTKASELLAPGRQTQQLIKANDPEILQNVCRFCIGSWCFLHRRINWILFRLTCSRTQNCSKYKQDNDRNFQKEQIRTSSRTDCDDLLLDSRLLLHLPQKVRHQVLLTKEPVSSFSDGWEDVQQAHGLGSGPGSGLGSDL